MAGKFAQVSSIAAMLLLLVSFSVKGNDTPPPGYKWRSCQVVECSFLIPDGWSFEKLEGGDVLKYQIIKERSNQSITPKVRISILRDSESRTGMTVERHLQLFTQDLQRKSRVLETWNNKAGVLTSRAATSLHYSNVDKPVKQFSLMVANDRTGTLYVFSFEVLPEAWEREWPVVEQFFSRLRFDDKI
ncbi:hypothetical protein M3P05_19495 [Sansalvadorimonas sp. 2012CJ34-2]|uniref:PsbP C-terminal domain-containing protein n=1 Tax=Parendozoicomonas callyspongiae TaxID=2942213 RepID=A0ABT0PL41_9GAMM|nr:hypothetical protein [Sansalvadorimonas sp. 2012CJ34-2]MCL6272110.1 hypothetical protein [Sansalvadorimonas sp. 2012CJ34-2]